MPRKLGAKQACGRIMPMLPAHFVQELNVGTEWSKLSIEEVQKEGIAF